jgi:hypothetical protein
MQFDGVNDNLSHPTLTNNLDNSDFLVSAVYVDYLALGITSYTPRLYMQSTSFSYNTLSTINYGPQTGHQLLSFQVVGANQEVFGKGISLGTATETQQDFIPNPFNLNVAGSIYGNGKLQEVIVYDSDQSTNRTGIETNINDYYDIY